MEAINQLSEFDTYRIRGFVKERNDALFSFNRRKIEKFMKKQNVEIPTNDIVFWATVCKCICNITNAPMDIRSQALAWLWEHHMSPDIIF